MSWQIEHLDTRLIVMWSVPFNFNLHDSYFAVGMIFNRGRFASSGYWFNQVCFLPWLIHAAFNSTFHIHATYVSFYYVILWAFILYGHVQLNVMVSAHNT